MLLGTMAVWASTRELGFHEGLHVKSLTLPDAAALRHPPPKAIDVGIYTETRAGYVSRLDEIS
jgi:hypothetical protein